MSFLNSKSTLSEKAANYLHSSHLYAPSIHCSYYRCYQKMLHIAYTKLGETENQLIKKKNLSNLSKKKYEKEGSHQFLINYFVKLLMKIDKNSAIKFNTKMNELRTIRIKADYQEIEINESESNSSIQRATEITDILTTQIENK